jgi:hypothetical protein
MACPPAKAAKYEFYEAYFDKVQILRVLCSQLVPFVVFCPT